MLPPHVVAEAAAISARRSPKRANTRPIGSLSARRAAGSISITTMPSRTKPTWINSTASISRRDVYIGQEVVSRVEHRGMARKRVVPVAFADFAAETGVG